MSMTTGTLARSPRSNSIFYFEDTNAAAHSWDLKQLQAVLFVVNLGLDKTSNERDTIELAKHRITQKRFLSLCENTDCNIVGRITGGTIDFARQTSSWASRVTNVFLIDQYVALGIHKN